MRKRKPKEHWKNMSMDNLKEKVNGLWYYEKWRKIKDQGGVYWISNFGRVKRINKYVKNNHGTYTRLPDRIFLQTFDKDGYLIINTSHECYKKKLKVHRLVAQYFLKNPKNKTDVNHKKGIKTDNRSWELEWLTVGENHKHAYAIGLRINKKGADRNDSKQVLQFNIDGKFIKEWGGLLLLQREFGINRKVVSACCRKNINHLKYSNYGYKWRFKKDCTKLELKRLNLTT